MHLIIHPTNHLKWLFYDWHHATHFFHKEDCEEIGKGIIRKSIVSSRLRGKSVSDDGKKPNEMSEMGSLDLARNKKGIGNLGKNRFCWVMGKETELEARLEAWMGSEEVEVMKEEEG